MSSAPDTESLDGIAIIGMSGRFPGAEGIEAFWRNLRDGVEARSVFTDAELESSGVPRELHQRSDYVRAGFVLDGAELFDAGFFGYSPREAELLDPQHRLFLECAWHALENAGHAAEQRRRAISVFASTSASSYLLTRLVGQPDLLQKVGLYPLLIGNDKDYLSTRVSHRLDLRGPSMTVQTACSSSLVAVHLACQSLLDGESDMALAGGVCISFPQRSGYLFQEGMILSPDGHCRAFDEHSQGTVQGSGVAVVVLKRLADAVEDGDTIHAVIRGSALNNDGSSKVGYTAPSVEGQAAVISEALEIAGIEPDSIQYIEAHGTGTALGDPIELAALSQAFKEGAGPGTCAIGSLKTNMGHLDAAAGVSGLLKTALALEHRQLPPSLHFTRPNPRIDFSQGPFYVNAALRDWPRGEAPRRAAVSAFGIGGTNAHVILEEAPEQPAAEVSARPWQLLVLSARNAQALDEATTRLADYLERNPEVPLADVAYTLQVGRKRFEHRRMLVCRSVEQARTALATRDEVRLLSQEQEATSRPVIFLFPGQGPQYVGMGRELYEAEPRFRQHVDACCERLVPLLGFDLRGVLHPAPGREKEAEERLHQMHVAQPAMFTLEYALAKLWMALGVKPQAMIGHSLGEYTAACLSGVLSLEDALRLVVARGRLMQSVPEGVMLSVALSEAELVPLLGPELSIAASNTPSLFVVGGPTAAVAALEETLKQRGVEHRRLHIARASHTAMMEPVLESYAAEVRTARLSPPRIPFITNTTGTWAQAETVTDPRSWVEHLRRPVRFSEGVQTLLAEYPDAVLLEVGPGRTLGTLVRQGAARATGHLVLTSLRGPRDPYQDVPLLLETVGRLWMAGVSLDWQKLHAPERRRRLPLPGYPFQRQRYWLETSGRSVRTVERQAGQGPCYVPSWSTRPASGVRAEVRSGSRWCVLTDSSGPGALLAEQLEAAGARVVRVLPGEAFASRGEATYVLPPGDPEGYRSLLTELETRGLLPEQVVYLWGLAPLSEEGASGAELERGFHGLAFLAQALQARAEQDEVRLTVVASGTQDVTGEEPVSPVRAMLLGASRVLPQELSRLRMRCIDVRPPEAGPGAARRLVTQVLAELCRESTEPVVALRGGQRWVCDYAPVPFPSKDSEDSIPLRPGGVYVLLGGLGQVGLALAEQLATAARAPRLVLVGRSPFPERSEWETWLATHGEHEATSRKLRRLMALESSGAEVLVERAEVSQPESLESLLARVEARFGAVHGVIHSAGLGGVEVRQPLGDLSRSTCESLFQAPVHGALALERVLRGRTLDFVVLHGSLSSVLGGFGLSAYAAANAFLESFAVSASRSGQTPWVSVAWDPWPASGSGQGPATGTQQLAPAPAEALRLLLGMLRSNAGSRWLVSREDLSERLSSSTPTGAQASRPAGSSSSRARPELRSGFVAPRDEVEQQVAAIWQELLGIEQVGVHDNFFELGGHSLMGVQVLSRVRAAFQVELSMRALFESPTVATLALAIVDSRVKELDPATLEALVAELEQEELQ